MGLSEMLLVQGETKSQFRNDAALRTALLTVSRSHQSLQAADVTLEEIAALTVNDERPVNTVDGAPQGASEATVKKLLLTFEENVLVRLRNRVRPQIVKSIPDSYPAEERSRAASEALTSATRVCILNEIVDLLTPPFLAGRTISETRNLPTAPLDGETANEFVVADGTSAGHSEPHPRNEQPDSSTPATAAEPRAETSTSAVETEEKTREAMPSQSREKEPPAAETKSTDGTTTTVAAAPTSEAPAAEETDEQKRQSLAYPLPEGNWTHCEDNPDFWWGEDLNLFYYPAAGHFMDPDSGMWYVAEDDKWLTGDEHEHLLAEMAQQGLY